MTTPSPKKIFLTGGTGFIGSHFINQGHQAGYDIVAVRRHPTSVPRIPLEREPTWIDKNLAEINVMDLEGCHAVIHLASAGVSPQIASFPQMIEDNVALPQRLFTIAAEANVLRWVVAGTFAEYGRAGERYEYIPPDAPLEPTFPYAASKAAFFSIIHSMAVSRQASLAYFRIFSVFGSGQYRENFWPSLREAAVAGKDFAMTPGMQIRDFIEVSQTVNALLKAVDRTDIIAGQPWVRNLASGNPVSMADFASYWWNEFEAKGRLIKGSLPYRENEVMRYVPDVDPSIFPDL